MNSQILLLRAQKLLTVIRGHLRSGVCIRGSASKASVAKPSVDAAVRSNVQFKHVIYRFKHIQAFQTLSLFKLGQTGLTVMLVPTMCLLYRYDVVPFDRVVVVLGMCGFAVVVLAVFSYFARRVVGVVSLDETGTLMRIGHLSFWGMRRNKYLQVDQVLRFTDSSEAGRRDLFLKLYYYEAENSGHQVVERSTSRKTLQATPKAATNATALGMDSVQPRTEPKRFEISKIDKDSLAHTNDHKQTVAMRRDYFLISIDFGHYPDKVSFEKVFGRPFRK